MNDSKELQLELIKLLEAKENSIKYNKRDSWFTDTGEFRRELYPKHIQFLNAGAQFSQRAFIAANRTGKTCTATYELSLHLTGDYPHWWEGRKFLNAISAWAVGRTSQTTKEVLQKELLGPINDLGTGMLPKDSIIRMTKKPGVADAIETIFVRHKSGGISEVTFKSYDQERISFEGTKKDVICLDEEPKDEGIYSECLTRTADKYNPGIIISTFTPLFGLSNVVMSFIPEGTFPENGFDPKNPYKFVINVEWDDVPHLSEEWKAEALASYPEHMKLARSKGIPYLSAGVIYPYTEEAITVRPFAIPSYWPKAYGMDVGERTAVVWGALDPDSNTIYIYSEYYAEGELPLIHAAAIKSRGAWIDGVVDTAVNAVSNTDRKSLAQIYEKEGLNLTLADKAIESGLMEVSQSFLSGNLKIFDNLSLLLKQIRIYRRDEEGKIIKVKDDLVDALRYLIRSFRDIMRISDEAEYEYFSNKNTNYAADKNEVTGY